jgi:mannose-6-phosphate isomerase
VQPVVLHANPVHRFYRGGPAIARFRGIAPQDEYGPEDWVGSATTVFGERELGLSRLPNGSRLADRVAADPEAFLGPEHAAACGADTGLLVKLLDAGERLPVHWHPDRAFARSHLDCPHGKTEAWGIVEAEPGAAVHLGFRRAVDRAAVAEWIETQDAEAMLSALHRVPVVRGDTVLVPAGTPHAIGQGVFLVELQEPTDLSVLMEWKGFAVDGAADGHLGLGFEVELGSLHGGVTTGEDLARLRSRRGAVRTGVEALFPAAADPFFRAESIRPRPSAELPAAFSILVVAEGTGALRTGTGDELPVAKGTTLLIPFAARTCALAGDLWALRCLPPEPDGWR